MIRTCRTLVVGKEMTPFQVYLSNFRVYRIIADNLGNMDPTFSRKYLKKCCSHTALMLHRPTLMQSDGLMHDRLNSGTSPGLGRRAAKVRALSTAYLKIYLRSV